ncbi:MAG: thrombospondin type 3 repeat-containing protein [Bacteroidia bacterium]
MEKYFSHSWCPSFICILLGLLMFGTNPVLQAQDYDNDGIDDLFDNCPTTPNADQIDKDGNGVGDACENPSVIDSDGDDWPNNLDNCPSNNNNTQYDHNNDGIGNYCDPALASCVSHPPSCLNGGLLVEGYISNPRSSACLCICPSHFTGPSCASGGSGPPNYPGYAISSDRDSDGIANVSDNAPYIANSSQTDSDGDGIGDATDNCYLTANASQTDTDGDGIGDDCESFAFPVRLLSYEAEIKSGRIHLNWVTGEENNNHFFIVDKSSDGQDFRPWKEVAAAGGDRNEPTNYEVWDEQIDNLIFHYYRLQQVDLDGTSRIIGIAEVDTRPYQHILPEIILFPNPIENQAEISLKIKDPFGEKTDHYLASIFDTQGKKIKTFQIPGKYTIIEDYQIKLSEKLPSGLYFLSISSTSWFQQISFVVK